jgi:hypothetical protein
VEENNQTPNTISSTILDQAGIGTIEIAKQPKSKAKYIVAAIVVAVLLLTLGITIFILSDSSSEKIAKDDTRLLLSSDEISSAQQTASNIVNLFAQKNFVVINTSHIHPLSPLANVELNEDVLTAYVDPTINWTSCQPRDSNVLRTARHTDTDNKLYDVTYTPMKCSTTDGSEYLVEFDMRRTANETNSRWQIYDINTAKGSPNA